jgi:hypothetical protein
MHFHLPKPLHGWREFAGEVGIIVVGVLIALAAEQVVEKFSWRERVHQAEASMSKELSDDDGSQAYERLAMSPCIAKELARAEQALIAERDRHVAFVAPALSPPPFRTWDANAWQAAVSSGATSHMSTERMYLWSSPYALTPDMNQGSLRESQDWAELDRISAVSAHPSDAERERMMGATRPGAAGQCLPQLHDGCLSAIFARRGSARSNLLEALRHQQVASRADALLSHRSECPLSTRNRRPASRYCRRWEFQIRWKA